jgi:hypothetical protein
MTAAVSCTSLIPALPLSVSTFVPELTDTVWPLPETVNSQLAEQFGIEANHAQGFWCLGAWLLTKLTTHALCVHLNRPLGKLDVFRIRKLAGLLQTDLANWPISGCRGGAELFGRNDPRQPTAVV